MVGSAREWVGGGFGRRASEVDPAVVVAVERRSRVLPRVFEDVRRSGWGWGTAADARRTSSEAGDAARVLVAETGVETAPAGASLMDSRSAMANCWRSVSILGVAITTAGVSPSRPRAAGWFGSSRASTRARRSGRALLARRSPRIQGRAVRRLSLKTARACVSLAPRRGRVRGGAPAPATPRFKNYAGIGPDRRDTDPRSTSFIFTRKRREAATLA